MPTASTQGWPGTRSTPGPSPPHPDRSVAQWLTDSCLQAGVEMGAVPRQVFAPSRARASTGVNGAAARYVNRYPMPRVQSLDGFNRLVNCPVPDATSVKLSPAASPATELGGGPSASSLDWEAVSESSKNCSCSLIVSAVLRHCNLMVRLVINSLPLVLRPQRVDSETLHGQHTCEKLVLKNRSDETRL